MATRMEVNYWAEDVKKAKEEFERWKETSRVPAPEVVDAYITALECHNSALSEFAVKSRRKLRRARAKNAAKPQTGLHS